VPDRGGPADIKSLDTNIFLYAADEDCREHDAAIRLVNETVRSPANLDRDIFQGRIDELPVIDINSP
jgi:hypothetical protein